MCAFSSMDRWKTTSWTECVISELADERWPKEYLKWNWQKADDYLDRMYMFQQDWWMYSSLGGTHTVIKSAEGNTMNIPLPSTVYVPSSEMLCWSVHPVLYLFTLYSEFDNSLPDCWWAMSVKSEDHEVLVMYIGFKNRLHWNQPCLANTRIKHVFVCACVCVCEWVCVRACMPACVCVFLFCFTRSHLVAHYSVLVQDESPVKYIPQPPPQTISQVNFKWG